MIVEDKSRILFYRCSSGNFWTMWAGTTKWPSSQHTSLTSAPFALPPSTCTVSLKIMFTLPTLLSTRTRVRVGRKEEVNITGFIVKWNSSSMGGLWKICVWCECAHAGGTWSICLWNKSIWCMLVVWGWLCQIENVKSVNQSKGSISSFLCMVRVCEGEYLKGWA